MFSLFFVKIAHFVYPVCLISVWWEPDTTEEENSGAATDNRHDSKEYTMFFTSIALIFVVLIITDLQRKCKNNAEKFGFSPSLYYLCIRTWDSSGVRNEVKQWSV